jgi:hypothetical protein
VDRDSPSELARAVRAHNLAVVRGDDVVAKNETGPRVIELASALQSELVWRLMTFEPALKRLVSDELGWLQSAVSRRPAEQIPPHRVSWLVSRLMAERRGAVLWLYGMTPQRKKEAERDHVRALRLALSLRGYDLVVDECTSPRRWYSLWLGDEVGAPAGVVWRGHGWFSSSPDLPFPPDVVSRVWTGACDEAGETKLFADTWASVVPEGLSFAVIASCGSAGAWTTEEVNSLEVMGDPEKLVFHTFGSELSDRALYVRGYRGYLVTGNYHLDRMSWQAATDLLVDRSSVEPERVEAGRAELASLLAGGSGLRGEEELGLSSDLLRVVDGVSPLYWIPRLIEILRACEQRSGGETCVEPEGRLSLLHALDRLASMWLDARAVEADLGDADEWAAWWESEPISDRRAQVSWVFENRPDGGWVWARLAASLRKLVGAFSPVDEPGFGLVAHCWASWLRCRFARLGPWRRSLAGMLTRKSSELPLDVCGPTDASLRVSYDPAERRLFHNLVELVSVVEHDEILAGCKVREWRKPEEQDRDD